MTKRSITNLYECVGYNDFPNDKFFILHLNNIIDGVKHRCIFTDVTNDDKNLKYEPFMA